ncbi:MAG: dTMP kinase [Acidimicrobiia bacterium]|nr:dTMP kinase [Acidimicrobiia bacterium]
MTNVPERGRFVVFEGPDASGKTTQARRLAERRGALFTREPGGTRIGEQIRDLLLDPTNAEMADRTEALLYAAARAQHVAEVIEPNLAAGCDVVCDRFVASSLAYQGVGRELGIDQVGGLSIFATAGLMPDLVVLVEVAVDVSLERLDGNHDRLEREGVRLLDQVNDAYRRLAAADPDRWAIVDGHGSVDDVAVRIDAVVEDRLGW